MTTRTIDIKVTITIDATDLIEELGEDRARAYLTSTVRCAFYESGLPDDLEGTVRGFPYTFRYSKIE